MKLDYEAKKTSTKEIKKNKQKKRTRKRKVLWYNPPFEEGLDTNVGKEFLKLIDKHFGKKRDDNLHKIINRKTVKIGYSCGPNFGNILKAHNRQVLEKHKEENGQKNGEKKCSCRRGEICPLNGDCLSEAVVYKATVKAENQEDIVYFGSTEGSMKQRLYGHKSDMRVEKNKNKTTLSKHMWELKGKGVNATIEWEIVKKCRKYASGDKKCDVCLTEKLEIMKGKMKGIRMLNKRNEMMYKCPHKRKFLLEK